MSNTQVRFIRILQDKCITKKGTYYIATSIYDLTYRSEIFLDTVLVDALEEECYYLAYDANKEENFKNKYIDAHQAIKQRYCKQEKNRPSKTKNIVSKLSIPSLDYRKLVNIFLGLLFSFVLIYLIKNSMNETSNNASLLKEETKYTPVKPRDINTVKVPQLDKIEEPTMELNINQEVKELFVWTPKEDMVLDVAHYFPLSFTNNSDMAVHVELTGRSLKESPHDEIVQFKDSDIYANMESGETKVFQVYIEPTYYKQFDKGKYTGTLTFALRYDKEQKIVKKQFSFEVK